MLWIIIEHLLSINIVIVTFIDNLFYPIHTFLVVNFDLFPVKIRKCHKISVPWWNYRPLDSTQHLLFSLVVVFVANSSFILFLLLLFVSRVFWGDWGIIILILLIKAYLVLDVAWHVRASNFILRVWIDIWYQRLDRIRLSKVNIWLSLTSRNHLP